MDTDFRVFTQALVPVPVELAKAVSDIFDESVFEGVDILADDFYFLVLDTQNLLGGDEDETDDVASALDFLEQARRDVLDHINVDTLSFFALQ